ncbi:hypothetical protein FACS18948_6570 [Clostridia bacterium]|nr:hypothetical protein FACS18948_6570 [Clostridia bacterium]
MDGTNTGVDTNMTGAADSAAGNQAENQGSAQINESSFDEVLKINKDYQAEFDRRIQKGIETAKTKWAQETELKVREADKLARMSEEQRQQHEREAQDKALAEREKALTARELRATAAEELARRGLHTALLDTLTYLDAETCNRSIDAAEKAVKLAVEHAVKARLSGSPPKAASSVSAASVYEERLKNAMGITALGVNVKKQSSTN